MTDIQPDTILTPRPEAETGTSQIRPLNDLVARTAEARQSSLDVHRRAVALDSEVLGLQLGELASELAQETPVELLETARSELGFSWEDLAQMVGVSSAALRKWRKGDSVTPQNRHLLAKTIAFCGLLKRRDPRISDPVQWLSEPFVDGISVRAIDLYSAGFATELFAVARGDLSRSALLERFDPDWRRHYSESARWTVETAADGIPMVVRER